MKKTIIHITLTLSAMLLILASGVFAYLSAKDENGDLSIKTNHTHIFEESSSDVLPTATPIPTVTTSTYTPTPTPEPTLSPTPSPTTETPPIQPPSPSPTPSPTPSGPVFIDGFLDPRSITPEIVSNPSSITVLVNKYYAVPSDYVPSLVRAESSRNQSLHPEAAAAWDEMREDCKEATGYTLYLTSGYRSYNTQKDSFESAIRNKGVFRAISRYAHPGRSEHQLGLALDIATTASPTISGSFLNTDAGKWVRDNGHLYGFILRYPSGKEHITGYAFEAWHYRYVGVELATELYNSGQTLEEYYGLIPNH